MGATAAAADDDDNDEEAVECEISYPLIWSAILYHPLPLRGPADCVILSR